MLKGLGLRGRIAGLNALIQTPDTVNRAEEFLRVLKQYPEAGTLLSNYAELDRRIGAVKQTIDAWTARLDNERSSIESRLSSYTTLNQVKDWIGLQGLDSNPTDDGFESCSNQSDLKACARMAIAACGRIGRKVGFINGQRHPSGPMGVICLGK